MRANVVLLAVAGSLGLMPALGAGKGKPSDADGVSGSVSRMVKELRRT